jgi:hypothetical protein
MSRLPCITRLRLVAFLDIDSPCFYLTASHTNHTYTKTPGPQNFELCLLTVASLFTLFLLVVRVTRAVFSALTENGAGRHGRLAGGCIKLNTRIQESKYRMVSCLAAVAERQQLAEREQKLRWEVLNMHLECIIILSRYQGYGNGR